MVYLTFIEREIKIQLSGAIQAGNRIKIGYIQDHMFFKILFFVAEKLLEKSKKLWWIKINLKKYIVILINLFHINIMLMKSFEQLLQ